MTITYATAPFTFVDSQYGSASNQNIKSLVNVAIDRRYHKEVQTKLFFSKTGMIGPDTYTEGGPTMSASGYPVIRKTELTREPGDTIKMGLRKNLSFAVSTGVVAATQLVDSEVGPDFYQHLVKIERWRQGVRIDQGMNAQRNPYEPFEQMEMSLLSDWTAQIQDTSLTYGMHYAYAPHLFRSYGSANLTPLANPNTLIGNDTTYDTTRTIANLNAGGQDDIKGLTFELGYTYCQEHNFDFVMIDGQPYIIALVSPRGIAKLYRDDEFRKSALFARERGDENILFRHATFAYYNVLIYEYDKIRTILAGKNPAGLSATGGTITEADYTGIGGGFSASQLHQTYFLGANALCLAEGKMAMGDKIRKEDDYGTIVGRAVDNIFGTKRPDWTSEDGATKTNQSSLLIVNSQS